MFKDTNKKKNEKVFAEHQATSGEIKPIYQAPIIMPLGELTKGRGKCQSGSVDTEHCHAGFSGGTSCQAGGTTSYCQSGSQPR